MLDHHLAGPALQLVLVLDLQAGQPLVVEADLAQHRCGQVAGRLEALGLLEEADALDLERRNLVGRGVVHLAGEIGEPAWRSQLVDEDVLVRVQDRRQGASVGDRVTHQLGVGPHRALADGHRQLHVVAVEDRPALGGDVHAPQTL